MLSSFNSLEKEPYRKLFRQDNVAFGSGDDILINVKEFPDLVQGDVLEIYHPEDEFSRLLLQVTKLSDDFQQKDAISIEQSITAQFNLRTYKDVCVNKVNPKDVAVDLLELLYKDQYFSRSDMWRLRHGLVNTCAYLTKKVEAAEMRVQVNELWSKGERVTCGIITEDTRIVFRSSTAVVQLYIQMSSEMWEFDINGDLYFEKAIDGFLTDLFAKWKEQNCLHDVTIVLFSRTFYNAQSKDEFPLYMRDCIQPDYMGRFYEDFYRVVIQNERYEDWSQTMKMLRKLFYEYPERVLNYHRLPGMTVPKARNSTAAEGNFLETLNHSLNLMEKPYVDRNFDRTGKVSVVITPGSGVFEVDRELCIITKQRTIDCGIGSDLVCIGEQPLHAAPLFKFHNKRGKGTDVGDDYNIPHWMNHSFYLSKNQIQARLRGTFVPRIKPPQIKPKKKSKEREFVNYTSPKEEDRFQFIDYDEYDAQVFKLPTRNSSVQISQAPSKTKRVPTSFAEAKKALMMSGRTRTISDDVSDHIEDKSKTSAISIPCRSSSNDSISASVPNNEKWKITKDMVSSVEDDGYVKPLVGSCGSPQSHAKRGNKGFSSRRALINPFAPSAMHFKMTSNRRRWIHAFPTDAHGAAMQMHHFYDTSVLGQSEVKWKKNALSRQDSNGSDGNGVDQVVGSLESNIVENSPPGVNNASLGSSTSYNLDIGRQNSVKKTKLKERSYVWGPTGEQEWSPEMTTGHDWRPLAVGINKNQSCLVKPILTADFHSQNFCEGISVDWKSLTTPASLPITTDFFPDKKSLNTDYVLAEYSLQSDNVNAEYYPPQSDEEKFFRRPPLTAKQIFNEMISQRLSQGFQVIIMPPKQRKPQVAFSSSPQYPHAMGLNRSRPRSETKECYLSIGRIFHQISLSASSIKVLRYRPRHPGSQNNFKYVYRFQAPDSFTYDVSKSNFRNEALENYNWNYLDHYICTRGESEYGLMESLKFWRSRFLILPCNNPATKKIIDGSSNCRCDIYEEKTVTEQQSLTQGFVRIMEILNKIKRTAKRTKLSGDPAPSTAASAPDIFSSAKPQNSSTDSVASCPAPQDVVTINSPSMKIIEAFLDAQTGLPVLTKQPGLPPNCFIAEDAVSWCMKHINGVTCISEAVELMQRFHKEKLLLHASGNPNHNFIYGFYFYYFTIPSKDKSKTENKVIDPERMGYNTLFCKNFMEVSIMPLVEDVVEPQPAFQLQEYPRKSSMTTINKEYDDWRLHCCVNSSIGTQNSDTLFHKYVNIDVDVSDKSDRPEWAQARYHAYFSPMCAFQIQIQWMVSTGCLLGELVYSWARRMTTCGFHLLPVPVDPFALPSAPDSDSLRGPIFIPVDVECLKAPGMPLFIDSEEENWLKKVYLFQIDVLKRYGFIPAGVRDKDDTMSPVCQGENYSYFVHCTGGMFVLIEDNQLPSPTSKSSKDSLSKKSSAEMRKDYIQQQMTSQPRLEFSRQPRTGFLWSWNFMSSKRWRTNNTGDEHFQDKVLADFREFCSNSEARLQEFWLSWSMSFAERQDNKC